MAGESPDRSKQRESSAEPTPGSAGPVPEARDPRLAVSREKDSSPGGADSATKVLSVRDVKARASEVPSEDTALREAVSAWVRGAASPGPTATDEPEAGEAETGSEATGADAEANAATEADADADSDADAKTDTQAKAAGNAEADAEEPTTADADADADQKADADDEKAGTQAKAGSEADTDRGAEAQAETDAEAGSNGGAGAHAETDTDRGAEADAEADADADAEKAGVKAKAEAGSEADADTDTGRGAEAEAETDADADTDRGAEADAEAGPDADADTDSGADADAETDTDRGAEAEVDAKAKAKAGEAEDGPEDADGEDAPQGPPAADDESRTGGAGGNTDAEGEAEADGDDAAQDNAPVDQPTTVFKAIKPKPAPQVDQPTTMLKLGGRTDTPKAPESDSERTSKFVALKNDMATAAKPEAKPAAKPDATTPVPQVGPERTTQQPLPPKPPLDLLAELTNTPPPPETAVRTIVRRLKIWTPLVLLLAIVFAVVQTLRPLPDPTLDLTAKDTYTFDGGKADIPWPAGGQAALDVQGIGTFGDSGDQKPVPIASVAKVMTAYLILRDHPLKSGQDGPKIRIDKPAEQQSDAGQESTVRVTAGDSISEREALEAILLPSANNVARLLARWDSHSEQAFTEKMNAAAKGLGMTNTTYTDPSGLTASTVSTAVDQVKLARAAMQQPVFREVAAMMSYNDYKGVNHSNYNRLVGHNNVVGIKTGTSTAALGNLVFAAKQQVGGETRTIIGAVLRQRAGGFDNTIISGVLDAGDKLIRAAQGALKSVTILKKGDVVGYVDDGLGGRTPIVATKDVTAAGWPGLEVKLSFTSGKVPHTAKAGTEVGSLTVGDGSAGAVKVPVALQKDLAEPGFGAKLTRLG
ncbi:D-alanyl-D-alanine carboxypeptidase [Streptomyces barringtoniae]|uniref:D-alanyl-D-alanine carboxypeptidase n=1 Tax=Streptomyces barringtoniae TaxID=2892029 RepID=UPI001E63FEB3|nr:D-alanyl-D-alanine carboxypeptidase [Streptomyces barringtoniae]MCC5478727.1 D-alanyl-D-alanine carboxypeptidase [Streptomyces barringtoniae]